MLVGVGCVDMVWLCWLVGEKKLTFPQSIGVNLPVAVRQRLERFRAQQTPLTAPGLFFLPLLLLLLLLLLLIF